VPSLPQVLAENGLPGVVPRRKCERVMLDSKRLETFYRELQTPSRIEANTPTPQMEDREEDPKSQLTQSIRQRRPLSFRNTGNNRIVSFYPRLSLKGTSVFEAFPIHSQ